MEKLVKNENYIGKVASEKSYLSLNKEAQVADISSSLARRFSLVRHVERKDFWPILF